VSLLVIITWSLGKARNRMLWQDQVQKYSIKLWLQPLVDLYDSNSSLKNWVLGLFHKWCWFAIIWMPCISSHSIFHEKAKHIEIDRQFIREEILSEDITTSFVNSNDQLEAFTESFRGPQIDHKTSLRRSIEFL
jgi:hypothetical protein